MSRRLAFTDISSPSAATTCTQQRYPPEDNSGMSPEQPASRSRSGTPVLPDTTTSAATANATLSASANASASAHGTVATAGSENAGAAETEHAPAAPSPKEKVTPHFRYNFYDETTKFYCEVWYAHEFRNLRRLLMKGAKAVDDAAADTEDMEEAFVRSLSRYVLSVFLDFGVGRERERDE